MKKGLRILILLSAFLPLVPAAGFSKTPVKGSEIKDMDSCTNAHGQWGIFGDVDTPRCRVKTSDKDTFCSDESECEGACIADLDLTQQQSIKYGYKINEQGLCSEWTLQRGCYYFVHKGFVKKRECVGKFESYL